MNLESGFTSPKLLNCKAPDIMASIGPTLEKVDDVKLAIKAGASWFRLPCGYRQRPHLENARSVRAASEQLGCPVQLLLDLPSSRPRTGSMQELRLSPGESVIFWDPEISVAGPEQADGASRVPLPGLGGLLEKLVPGQRMWFCDGRLSFLVDQLKGHAVLAHMLHGTVPLKSSNALFLPDSTSAFCPITPADRNLLSLLAADGLLPDWVALSLISSARDLRDARREVHEHFCTEVKIMAKFETVAAVESASEILKEADGIMVARGDLGLAVGYVRLPEIQERLVTEARKAGKLAVVATQVLEVFAETGLPQRAELSDLSLIARQRANVVMLGKETVYSPRPIECIRFAREVLTYESQRLEKSSRRPLKRVAVPQPLSP